MSAAPAYVGPEYLSCADTAKLVRVALKASFPGVKFSVRSETYSGGASINISWTDGPRAADVDKVVQRFSGADFDGSIDMKCYNSSWIEQDGSVHLAEDRGTQGSMGYLPERIEDPTTPGARLVHFGADFVFTHREVSDEWRNAIFALFSELIGRNLDPTDWSVWRTDVPLAVNRLDGRLHRMVETDTDDLSSVYHQFVSAREGGSLDVSATMLEP